MSSTFLRIVSPPSIAGLYQCYYNNLTSTNETLFNNPSITYELKLANDNSDQTFLNAQGNPAFATGCSSLPPNSLLRKMGVVLRGDNFGTGQCTFIDKVTNCQNAGATAVLVINNLLYTYQAMSLANSIRIPVINVTMDLGKAIIEQLLNNVTVSAQLVLGWGLTGTSITSIPTTINPTGALRFDNLTYSLNTSKYRGKIFYTRTNLIQNGTWRLTYPEFNLNRQISNVTVNSYLTKNFSGINEKIAGKNHNLINSSSLSTNTNYNGNHTIIYYTENPFSPTVDNEKLFVFFDPESKLYNNLTTVNINNDKIIDELLFSWNLIGGSLNGWQTDIPLTRADFNNNIWFGNIDFKTVQDNGFKIRLTGNWNNTKHFGIDKTKPLIPNKVFNGNTISEINISTPGSNIELNEGKYTIIYFTGIIDDFINSGKIFEDMGLVDYKDRLFYIPGNVEVNQTLIKFLLPFIIKNNNVEIPLTFADYFNKIWYKQNVELNGKFNLLSTNNYDNPLNSELFTNPLNSEQSFIIDNNIWYQNYLSENSPEFNIPKDKYTVIYYEGLDETEKLDKLFVAKGDIAVTPELVYGLLYPNQKLALQISKEGQVTQNCLIEDVFTLTGKPSHNINSSFKDGDNWATGVTIKMLTDSSLVLDDEDAFAEIPVGVIFDGDCKILTLSGSYKITATSTVNGYKGPLWCNGGTIKNLRVEKDSDDIIVNTIFNSGACGWLSRTNALFVNNNTPSTTTAWGRIEYCSTNIDINTVGGGIVGALAGSNKKLIISNCFSTGNILQACGGIAGHRFGFRTQNEANMSIIENCYSTGEINSLYLNSISPSGGIVGNSAGYGGYCLIKNCYSTGKINLGGGITSIFAGTVSGNCFIENCYSTGEIGNEAGGITGLETSSSGYCKIKNCFSTGKIGISAGGICGRSTSLSNGFCQIENCYSTGELSQNAGGIIGDISYGNIVIINSYSTATVPSDIGAGAIAGSSACFQSTSNLYLFNCYGNGSVVGGLVNPNLFINNQNTNDVIPKLNLFDINNQIKVSQQIDQTTSIEVAGRKFFVRNWVNSGDWLAPSAEYKDFDALPRLKPFTMAPWNVARYNELLLQPVFANYQKCKYTEVEVSLGSVKKYYSTLDIFTDSGKPSIFVDAQFKNSSNGSWTSGVNIKLIKDSVLYIDSADIYSEIPQGVTFDGNNKKITITGNYLVFVRNSQGQLLSNGYSGPLWCNGGLIKNLKVSSSGSGVVPNFYGQCHGGISRTNFNEINQTTAWGTIENCSTDMDIYEGGIVGRGCGAFGKELVINNCNTSGNADKVISKEFPSYDNTALSFINYSYEPRPTSNQINTRLLNSNISDNGNDYYRYYFKPEKNGIITKFTFYIATVNNSLSLINNVNLLILNNNRIIYGNPIQNLRNDKRILITNTGIQHIASGTTRNVFKIEMYMRNFSFTKDIEYQIAYFASSSSETVQYLASVNTSGVEIKDYKDITILNNILDTVIYTPNNNNEIVRSFGFGSSEGRGNICGWNAGYKGLCKVNNCYSSGTINRFGGGICGYQAGLLGSCIINNCYSTGSIGVANTTQYAGGICGGYAGYSGKCEINNCYSTGSISMRSGGICGGYAGFKGLCNIQHCYSTGEQIANNFHGGGGICGLGAGNEGKCQISKCYSTGKILGTAGGITGWNSGFNGYCSVKNCFSTGNIHDEIFEFEGGFAGGISGSNAGGENGFFIAENCYSLGDIYYNSGGIVGDWAGYDSGLCVILNCYSLGKLMDETCGSMTGIEACINNNNSKYSYGNLHIYNCYGNGRSIGSYFGRNVYVNDTIPLIPNNTSTASTNGIPSLNYGELYNRITKNQMTVEKITVNNYSFSVTPWNREDWIEPTANQRDGKTLPRLRAFTGPEWKGEYYPTHLSTPPLNTETPQPLLLTVQFTNPITTLYTNKSLAKGSIKVIPTGKFDTISYNWQGLIETGNELTDLDVDITNVDGKIYIVTVSIPGVSKTLSINLINNFVDVTEYLEVSYNNTVRQYNISSIFTSDGKPDSNVSVLFKNDDNSWKDGVEIRLIHPEVILLLEGSDRFAEIPVGVTFNGMGSTIKIKGTYEGYKGPFWCNGGTIRFVTVELSDENLEQNKLGNKLITPNKDFTTGACGWISRTNCKLVYDSEKLIYYNIGDTCWGKIELCQSNIEIEERSGGIVGCNAATNGKTLIIENCETSGDMTGIFAGGICASFGGGYEGKLLIKNCITYGNMLSNRCGGICSNGAGGYGGECIIRNCNSNGFIYNNRCGGICSSTTGAYNGNCIIENCESSGKIIREIIFDTILFENFSNTTLDKIMEKGWVMKGFINILGLGNFSFNNWELNQDYISTRFTSDLPFGTNFSQWLISPVINFNDVNAIQFRRYFQGNQGNLSILISINNDSTNIGTDATTLGDFVSLQNYFLSGINSDNPIFSFNNSNYLNKKGRIAFRFNSVKNTNPFTNELRLYEIRFFKYLSSVSSNATSLIFSNFNILNGERDKSAGGIVSDWAGLDNGKCIIKNCVSNCNIDNNCGGIVSWGAGFNGYCSVENCYTNGNQKAFKFENNAVVEYTSNQMNAVTPVISNAGGIVGLYAGIYGICIIKNSFYKGTISINSGGICSNYAGDSGLCIIQNCFSTGDIPSDSGGICGRFAGNNNNNSFVSSPNNTTLYNKNSLCLIQNCFATGKLIPSRTNFVNTALGSLILDSYINTNGSICALYAGYQNNSNLGSAKCIVQNCYGNDQESGNTNVINGNSFALYSYSDFKNLRSANGNYKLEDITLQRINARVSYPEGNIVISNEPNQFIEDDVTLFKLKAFTQLPWNTPEESLPQLTSWYIDGLNNQPFIKESVIDEIYYAKIDLTSQNGPTNIRIKNAKEPILNLGGIFRKAHKILTPTTSFDEYNCLQNGPTFKLENKKYTLLLNIESELLSLNTVVNILNNNLIILEGDYEINKELINNVMLSFSEININSKKQFAPYLKSYKSSDKISKVFTINYGKSALLFASIDNGEFLTSDFTFNYQMKGPGDFEFKNIIASELLDGDDMTDTENKLIPFIVNKAGEYEFRIKEAPSTTTKIRVNYKFNNFGPVA